LQLTKKASYGLIAAFELARSSDSMPLSASSIAQRYALPVPFVEKILHRLGQSGLVESRQGRSGGYALAADPKEISVRQILEALDESLDLVGCLGTDTCCDLTEICPTKPAWSVINRRFHALLDALSLEDLHNSENLASGDPESRTSCKESSAT
jgi:Rrf2 family iron-sulfur cluster assembly transcriptional regulator